MCFSFHSLLKKKIIQFINKPVIYLFIFFFTSRVCFILTDNHNREPSII